MRIYRIDPQKAREIHDYESANVTLSTVARVKSAAQISYVQLGANSRLGYHQATVPQLFWIVEGTGWVRSDSSGHMPISKGQAAFWERNEWHESGTETGLAAIVIEGDELADAELASLGCWTVE